MIYEEGEGFVIVLAFVVPMAMFGLGYSAGHNAATAAIHKESS